MSAPLAAAAVDAPSLEFDRVVDSFRALLGHCPSIPKMEAHDGKKRWVNWGLTMGSNSSSRSTFRTITKPASKSLMLEFQESLSDYLFSRRDTSCDAEKRSLAELFVAVRDAQATWKEARADSADDASDSDDE